MRKINFLILGFSLFVCAAAQNIGIGTNALRAKLEVPGVAGIGATSAIFGADGAGISLQRNPPTIGFNQYRDDITLGGLGKYMATGFAAVESFDPANGTFTIDIMPSGTANAVTPSGTRAIAVLANGNVAIRGASPTATLSVARGTGVNGTAVFAGTTHSSHFNYGGLEDTYIRAGVNKSNVYINTLAKGNVLIGFQNSKVGFNLDGDPQYTIDIKHYSPANAFTLIDSYNNRWSQGVNGPTDGVDIDMKFWYKFIEKSQFRLGGVFYSLSDSSVKVNIEGLSPVLENVNRLNAVTYVMKNNNPGSEKSIGFVAQDVVPLFPLLVRKVQDVGRQGTHFSDLHTMDYGGFGVIAIKALQEQWQQIQQLQQEQEQLLGQLRLLAQQLGMPAQ